VRSDPSLDVGGRVRHDEPPLRTIPRARPALRERRVTSVVARRPSIEPEGDS
jgi:hypothetical protein